MYVDEKYETMMQAQEEALKDALVAYIVERKVVAFEDVSLELKMRTKDVVAYIKGLEESGKLTGIMDDRGKVCALRLCPCQSAGASALLLPPKIR